MPRPPPVVPFIQTGNPEMDRLQRFVAQALPGKQDRWSAPTLLNGWVNFDITSFQPAGYIKDSNGFVRLRGLLKSGTTAAGTVLFTLPIGYRPSKALIVPVVSNDLFGEARLQTDGSVQFWVGSNVFFSLDGINFDTR